MVGRVMNLRTPRRRISPRTKRHYRAIKNFLRRTLGSSSQPDTQINSTISVSELKHKIVGIEHQLNTVSKHCRDLACFEKTLEPNTVTSSAPRSYNDIYSNKDTHKSKASLKEAETKIIYQSSEDQIQRSNHSRCASKIILNIDDNGANVDPQNKMKDQNYAYEIKTRRKNKRCDRLDTIQETRDLTVQGHKHYPKRHNLPASFSTTSFHTLNDPRISSRCPDAGSCGARRLTNHYIETNDDNLTRNKNLHVTERKHRSKYTHNELDQDFITDIIRRQYRPVKLFGRRESDYSQFSAPVCRDQDFTGRENVQEDVELCSCCYNQHRHRRHSRYMCCNDLSDIRSICDTRLYSSKKHRHHRRHRERLDDYNDSAMYDIVPVKEKCSPKSRRKFLEDNTFVHQNYREVPPSPRTLRPRLNLKAQYHTDDDDALPRKNQQKYRPVMQYNGIDSNMSSEVFIHNRKEKGIHKSQIPNNQKPGNLEGTSLQYQLFPNELNNNLNDITLNTQTTDLSADKTDKTLSEIKDILQNFLHEIKKEASQNDKLNCTPKTLDNSEAHAHTNIMPNSGHSFNNNCSFGQCTLPPFMLSYTNPCCYPLLPVCPMNCMQNGFVMQSPSVTCAACANNSKEPPCYDSNNCKKNITSSDTTNTETQKLIKEIHKFLSQNPNSLQKRELSHVTNLTTPRKEFHNEDRNVTSRSVGGSSKASKHDAKVGTTMKCYSKSCEAIGSRVTTDTHIAANTCYSDTVLEKGSVEGTTAQSSTESDYSSESTEVDKVKGNKFKNILRSIGLLKKNENDVIEELSESDSSTEIEKAKLKPPFQQHIMNCTMHGQEYFHPPPIPPHMHHQIQPHQYEYYGHLPNCDPRSCHAKHPTTKTNTSYPRPPHGYQAPSHYGATHHLPPCTSYYDPHCTAAPPPLCLKEIEVKSIGTQSVRKMSLLKKFTNKMQVPMQQVHEQPPKQNAIQTSKEKPGANLFNWKNLQAKAMQSNSDPLKFSYKTQKQLAEGDIKMRNAMLKKLFYKRNPFSPRNLLIKTLLGRDRSSFGEPPRTYKTKMFL